MEKKSLWTQYLLLFHSRWGRLLSTIGAITHCRCKVGEWKTKHNLASFSLRESMPVFSKQGAMELLKGAPGDTSCLASKDSSSHLPKQAAHLACCYCLEALWFYPRHFLRTHKVTFLMTTSRGKIVACIKVTQKRINHMTNTIKIQHWPKEKHGTISTKRVTNNWIYEAKVCARFWQEPDLHSWHLLSSASGLQILISS